MYKMFSLTIKKRATCLQVRQIANLICNKTRVDRKGINILINCTHLNYSSLVNPKHKTYCRPFYDSVRMMSDKSQFRQLMYVPLIQRPPLLNWFYKFQFYMQVRRTIDETFDFDDFEIGAIQAVQVVSNALVSQNYEAINGLVEDNVLQEIIKRVDSLKESHRQLLSVYDKNIMTNTACNMSIINRGEDNNDLEITQIGYYVDKSQPTEGFASKPFELNILVFNYTFRRNYKHGEGGPWIITMANHFLLVNNYVS